MPRNNEAVLEVEPELEVIVTVPYHRSLVAVVNGRGRVYEPVSSSSRT